MFVATSRVRITVLSVILLYTAAPFFVHAQPSKSDCRIPLSSQPFLYFTSKLTPTEAAVSAKRILKELNRAGEAVRANDLARAMRILDDLHLLDGTGFQLDTERPVIDTATPAATERAYHHHLLLTMRPKPGFSKRNQLVIPHIPAPGHPWAERAFIRAASEELGHIAQKLDERARANGGAVSAMFTGEYKAAFESLRVTEHITNQFLASENERYTGQTEEMDVYALLIEVFGPDFMPAWFGQDSGHAMRAFVDQTLKKRGVTDRDWH